MSWLNKIKNSSFFGAQNISKEEYFLVVGLGNPGDKYISTRHNFGRDFLIDFKEKNSLDFSDWQNQSKFSAQLAEGIFSNKKLVLMLPETFMNLSGQAVQKYLTFTKAKPTLIVIHDDVDLPLGKVKVSTDSGAGGHNGVASVIDALGTKNFVRIRLGVGKSEVTPTDKFVLEKFTTEEHEKISEIFSEVGRALEKVVSD